MATFLSDEWFNTVDQLTAQAGDLQLSSALSNLKLNVNVDNNGTTVPMSIQGGKFSKGNADGATTTVNTDAETLRKVFLEFDMAAAMQAFMSGKIKVDGDMSQLMALQSAQPSAAQKELVKNILAQTT